MHGVYTSSGEIFVWREGNQYTYERLVPQGGGVGNQQKIRWLGFSSCLSLGLCLLTICELCQFLTEK